jgi:UMF1 family MFS transporter
MSLDGDDDEIYRVQPQLRYEGEDTSATTIRELNGWYAYPIAAEVFAVVAVGNYNMPQTMRKLH